MRSEFASNHVRVVGDVAAALQERLPELYEDLEPEWKRPLPQAGARIAQIELAKGIKALGVGPGKEEASPGTTVEGGSRVGLRGGAPGGDSGLVGSEVVISGPRVAGVWSVSVRDVPAVAAGAGGKEAERWFDHARRDGSGSQASGYRVSSDGSLAFSDGVVLSPDGWVRIGVAGADFVHMPEGVVLRADTGEIVRVGNRDQLGRMLADKLFGAVPYTLVRGPAGLYLVPAGAKDGLAVYVPLSADLGAFVASAWSVTPGGLVRAGRWGVDFGGLRFWLQSVVGAAGGDGFGEALVASLGAAGVVGAPRT
ncbi:hypothetical protein, partial [Actinoallomurus spadix]|uniref:hypothetical protein n=1 Tax=Actinoallomurus spadix TaxID=79912 RepID=UPI0031D713BB